MRASEFEERKLSKGEETEKERIVKGMKKAKGSFKDRYGKDAEAVMYATATKLAKGESVEEGVKRNILYREIGKRLARGQDIDKIKKYYKDIDNKYPGHIEKIVQALKDRNEIPFKVKEEKKNCGCNQDPCITYGKQEESKDEYEPHMMYKGTKKDYRAKFPKKKKQHDSLMKRGYNHDDPETKKVEEYVFTRKDFLDNEAENLHSENAVEIAKKFGTPKEIKQMDDILTRHNKRGHITPEDQETRDALVRKYYSMLEGDVPTQKGRDAKHNVLTPKAKNTVLKQIKKDANKQRRKMSKDAVVEDTEHDDDYGYSWNCKKCGTANEFRMTPQEQQEYIDNWEKDNQDLVADGETGESALDWALTTMGDESGMHIGSKCKKCGTVVGGTVVGEKADKEEDYKEKLKTLLKIQMDPNTSKDPQLKKELIRRKAKLLKTKESLQNEIEWKLQETALAEGYEGAIIHALKQEGINGFFNKGTLYIEDNADMERVEEIVNQTVQIPPEIKPEDDYYQLEDDSGLQGSVTPQQISKQFPGVADKNNLVQALLKMKRGDTNYSRAQMIAAADAFKDLLSKDPMETQKLMMLLKRVKAKETR